MLYYFMVFLILIIIPALIIKYKSTKNKNIYKPISITFILILLFFSAITDFDELNAYLFIRKHGWPVESIAYQSEVTFLDKSQYVNPLDGSINSTNKLEIYDIASPEIISAMMCSERVGLNVYPYIGKTLRVFVFDSPSSLPINIGNSFGYTSIRTLVGIYDHKIVFSCLNINTLPSCYFYYLPINYSYQEVVQTYIDYFNKQDPFYDPIYGDRKISFLPGGYQLFCYGGLAYILDPNATDFLNSSPIIPNKITKIGMNDHFVFAQQHFSTSLNNYYILDTDNHKVYTSSNLSDFILKCNSFGILNKIEFYDVDSFEIKSNGRLTKTEAKRCSLWQLDNS